MNEPTSGESPPPKRTKSSVSSLLTLLFGVGAVLTVMGAINYPRVVRARKHTQSTCVLEELRMVDAAIFQYSVEFKKQPGDPVSWKDVQLYLDASIPVIKSGGKDMLGGAIQIKKVGDPPKIADSTFHALSVVAPAEFWSPFR